MQYQEHPPHPGLKKHIRCYWTISASGWMSPHEGVHFLAEGLEFSFNLTNTIESVTGDAKSWVWGPMTRTMRMRPTREVEVFGICFRPGGAYPFFPIPLNELMNSCVELYDLWESRNSDIIYRVQYDCATTEERTELLNGYFLHCLDAKQRKDSCIAAAVDAIEAYKGQVHVNNLAGLVGLSNRQLERDFRERVGMSPKQLCRSMRFKNVFKHLAASPADSWAATALTCGYYDQSHMIKDFRHYTGISPAAYFAKPRAMEGLFTGNF